MLSRHAKSNRIAVKKMHRIDANTLQHPPRHDFSINSRYAVLGRPKCRHRTASRCTVLKNKLALIYTLTHLTVPVDGALIFVTIR